MRGFSPVRDKQDMAKIFGEYSQGQFQLMYTLCSDPGELIKSEQFQEFDLPPVDRRRKFLEYLQGVIDGFEECSQLLRQISADRRVMERNYSGVPEAPRLDRLLKYRASIQRDFERTLNQLERLQRIRKGQPVPPTLNVNVST